MKLIIGGCYQGKLDYAKTLVEAKDIEIIDGAIWDFSIANPIKIFYHLHDLVGRCLRNNQDVAVIIKSIIASNPQVILICSEVGSGIVPADPGQRAWREATGRLCCELAKEAEQVIRVCCGLPRAIKGDELC